MVSHVTAFTVGNKSSQCQRIRLLAGSHSTVKLTCDPGDSEGISALIFPVEGKRTTFDQSRFRIPYVLHGRRL